ncbi:MAG: Na/Pi cotransporter family protein [Bacteroidales bacterium]|nr:Na/Pi cotransporter family protein [Bacteroidales bacterium]
MYDNIDIITTACETATATFANVNIFLIFGGLGLFLYGMKMMMDGLEVMAGNKMRIYIEKATANRFAAVGIGALVTILIQSSTATSVMAVGFINAGLMSLAQAISLILGAHIGTTLTAHLFAFPGITTAAPLLIFFGLIAYLFFRKQTTKDVGFILLGIGILFFGLSVMGEPLRELAGTDRFQSILSAFENPFFAVLAGFLFTAIIQSSTAATGILITLLLKGDVDISFTVAAFLVLGISAGTTITALIASLAGRRESKRAALANLIYISIGCLVFGTLISVFPGILRWFENTWTSEAAQLAWFYTFFKVVLTFTFLPFVGHLASFMYVIMPKRNKDADSKQLLFMKTEIPQSPDEAIEQATHELSNMGQLTLENLKRSLDAFFTGDSEAISTVHEVESSINYLQKQISSMLAEVQNVESAEDMKKLGTLLYVTKDFERIGDHAKNFVEYNVRTKKKQKFRLSPVAVAEISTLGNAVVEIVTLSLEAFNTHSEDLIRKVNELEEKIDDMVQRYIENHVKRLKTEEKSDPRGGVAFLGMINDLERCADHAHNIASYYKK